MRVDWFDGRGTGGAHPSEGQSAREPAPQDRPDPVLVAVGALMRAGAAPLSPIGKRAGWVLLRNSVERKHRTGRWLPRPLVVSTSGMAVAVLLMMCGAFFWQRGSGRGRAGDTRADSRSPALSYAVDADEPWMAAAQADDGRGVHGGNTSPTHVRFSDGSDISVKPKARARIVSVENHGARIALEDGELAVDVTHRAASHWRFDAGPFSVFVEGTSFSLRWTAADERLHLRMNSGVVSVKGPLGTESLKVRGGETLTVRLPERQIALQANEPDSVAAVAAATAPADSARLSPSPPDVPVAQSFHHGHPAAHRGTPSRWRELVAQGRSGDVVAEAESAGLNQVVATRSQDDLAALADAARYGRRNQIARRALQALRERFPASESARDAAFFLGRLEEEADSSGSARSLAWYRRYRAEAPRGLYVADALGREMLVVERMQGREAARSTARQYLQRFPTGDLVPQARQVAAGE